MALLDEKWIRDTLVQNLFDLTLWLCVQANIPMDDDKRYLIKKNLSTVDSPDRFLDFLQNIVLVNLDLRSPVGLSTDMYKHSLRDLARALSTDYFVGAGIMIAIRMPKQIIYE